MCPIHEYRTTNGFAYPDLEAAIRLSSETRDSERFAALGVVVTSDLDATLVEMDAKFDAFVAAKVSQGRASGSQL